jgi:uncharacterized protein
MIQLSPDEARVLGVLIEKAMTTPEQYPLSLNAIVSGCNQKSNRDPVVSFDDDQAREAVERLREKGLAVRVDQAGGRVSKYRHQAGETLRARGAELAILAELLLRGPQTVGELRGRASRMQPLESIDSVKGMLTSLMEREEPLVRQIAPAPGSRAERYMQLLCPELHPVQTGGGAGEGARAGANGAEVPGRPSLAVRVEQLEAEVAMLKGGAAAAGRVDRRARSGGRGWSGSRAGCGCRR